MKNETSSNQTTQHKGDIAVLKTILNLRNKGWYVFREVVNESLPFDLIAYKEKKFIKIQCKYSENGKIRNYRQTVNTKQTKRIPYTKEDFDYYAIYCPEHDVVLYPSVFFDGCVIAYEPRKTSVGFYYWKDFLDLTNTFQKRNYTEFGIKLPISKKPKNYIASTKINWPTNEILKNEVFETPLYILCKKYKCSGNAIKKHCLKNDILLPKQGFWQAKNKKMVSPAVLETAKSPPQTVPVASYRTD